MCKSYTDDFFRDLYNSELELEHKLESADGLFVGILLALAAVAVYYSKLLPSCGHGLADCIFRACAVLFLIVFVFATGFLIASLWPRLREYIGTAKEWGAFVEGSKDYYTHYHNEQEADRRVAADLAQALRRKYIQAGEVNRNFNITKLAFRFWAKVSIMVAVVLVLINAIPTYLVQAAKTETQKTEVIGFPEIQKVEIVIPKPKGEFNERTKKIAPAVPGTTETGIPKVATPKAGASPEHPAKGG
jgi:hypothetical protein